MSKIITEEIIAVLPSHSQFRRNNNLYLDLHGLVFETSIYHWQDQPGSDCSFAFSPRNDFRLLLFIYTTTVLLFYYLDLSSTSIHSHARTHTLGACTHTQAPFSLTQSLHFDFHTFISHNNSLTFSRVFITNYHASIVELRSQHFFHIPSCYLHVAPPMFHMNSNFVSCSLPLTCAAPDICHIEWCVFQCSLL